eukprot:TRINITY_DN12186_c0_g1_i1.p1 TRINITY_DN12186_c0_g1~~TRINITY_DN12186_c0_g1_i1.p1  ORF type:complete len:123 (-),score=10.90 TRINITY_DN12186_c0_g1_i1:95-412(-)
MGHGHGHATRRAYINALRAVMKPLFRKMDNFGETRTWFRETRNVWPFIAGAGIFGWLVCKLSKANYDGGIQKNMLTYKSYRKMMSVARGGSGGVPIGEMQEMGGH